MTTTKHSPTPTSDAANLYAVEQRDGQELKAIARAYDAGAAAQSARIAELEGALTRLCSMYEGGYVVGVGPVAGEYYRCEVVAARSLLAKEGA